MKKTTVYKPTKDNFCPSLIVGRADHWFSDNEKLVRVNYHGNISYKESDKPCFRVSVWGTDDFGLEKDFESDQEAINLFMQIIQEETLSIQYLRTIGLYNA